MSKIDKHEFSGRVYITRKMFNETQIQYAKRLGVSERTIRNWEHSKVEKPRQVNFKKIQRRYRYFKNEVKQAVQVKMKRKLDKRIVWSRTRSFEDLYKTLVESDFYKNEYSIIGFRRINLMKSSSEIKKNKKRKSRILWTAEQMIKKYK